MPDTDKGENNKHVSFLEKQYKLYKKRYKLDKNNTGCVEKVQIVQKVQSKILKQRHSDTEKLL